MTHFIETLLMMCFDFSTQRSAGLEIVPHHDLIQTYHRKIGLMT